KQPRWMN
ncbi:terminase small subunit, partial [Escherichia coli 96.0932]